MQTAYYERTGASDVLQLGELPDPVPGPGEVRVRLRWSGVNPADVKARAGLRNASLPFPRIVPHSDGMGIIDAFGDGVSNTRVGERAWVWNAAWGRPSGTAAQWVVVPQEQAVVLPDEVADAAGACLGIPALTALHANLMAGGVSGKTVLVAGGAGSVGYYAVQFARLLGARHVLATVGDAQKAACADAAGADTVIDYRRDDIVTRVREATHGAGVDRIIEVDMAANAMPDVELLAVGGDCVVYGSGAPRFELPFYASILKHLTLRCFIVFTLDAADRRRTIATLNAFLARGALSHNIDQRFTLFDIARAHDAVEQHRATGHVALSVP